MKFIEGVLYAGGKQVRIYLDHIVAVQEYSDEHTTIVTTSGTVLVQGSFAETLALIDCVEIEHDLN